MVQILISVQSADEFRTVRQAGIGWIDLKDPSQGSLGAPLPVVVREVAHISCVDSNQPIGLESATAASQDFTLSLAAGELLERRWEAWLGDLDLQAYQYIKVALAGCREFQEWPILSEAFQRALPDTVGLILVHYADWARADAPDFEEVLQQSIHLGLPFLLIDTWKKDGQGLLEWYSPTQLTEMIARCHDAGIQVSLAGGLQLSQFPDLISCRPDVLAVRGAACRASDRTSQLCDERIRELVQFQQTQLPQTPFQETQPDHAPSFSSRT